MSRREKLVYLLAGALLLAFLVAGGLYALADPDDDVDAALDEVAGDRILFRIDLSAAFALAEEGGGRAVTIPPDTVLAGDPAYVRGAVATERGLEVQFEGLWPTIGGYPLVLNEEGIVVRSQATSGRNGEQLTRVSFAGRPESVGTVTFILGECADDAQLPTIIAVCEKD